MLTKAVIEQIINKNTVKVRVPIINLSSSDASGTPNKELPIATICTLPQCYLNPQVNDVVYVSFEDDDFSKPVIVGYLQRDNQSDTAVDITVGELTVNGQINLPQTTTIGSITASSLGTLQQAVANQYSNQEEVNSRLNQIDYTIGDWWLDDPYKTGLNIYKKVDRLQELINTVIQTPLKTQYFTYLLSPIDSDRVWYDTGFSCGFIVDSVQIKRSGYWETLQQGTDYEVEEWSQGNNKFFDGCISIAFSDDSKEIDGNYVYQKDETPLFIQTATNTISGASRCYPVSYTDSEDRKNTSKENPATLFKIDVSSEITNENFYNIKIVAKCLLSCTGVEIYDNQTVFNSSDYYGAIYISNLNSKTLQFIPDLLPFGRDPETVKEIRDLAGYVPDSTIQWEIKNEKVSISVPSGGTGEVELPWLYITLLSEKGTFEYYIDKEMPSTIAYDADTGIKGGFQIYGMSPKLKDPVDPFVPPVP